MTCMLKRPRQSSATRRPTLPMPTMPMVRPLTSLPMKTPRSCIVPRRKAWLVWMICLESISTMASTCVATASALPPVWLTTSTPASVQSLTLTVSKPAPLVETMSRFGMRGRHDRPGTLVGGFVLELVEPDLRPLRDDVEIAGVRDVAHVEHALHVVLHFLKVLGHSSSLIAGVPRPTPA